MTFLHLDLDKLYNYTITVLLIIGLVNGFSIIL